MNPWIIATPTVLASASALTAYGAAYPRAQLFGPTSYRTTSPHKLAITFDDGPNPAITPNLLDLLDRYKAHATFFLIGQYVRQCPDLVREISSRGHILGCHTDTHRNLFWAGPQCIHDELFCGSDAIATAIGALPKWFRPPWGLRNPWLASIARELDMRTAMWTLMPDDWRAPSAEWLIARMQPIASRVAKAQTAATGSGDILCLHDGSHRGLNWDRTRTLAALEHWLPRWRDLGLEFATIDQAVHTPAT